MEKINHSKFKNTGLIFELLTRQIAADALNNSNSKALNLINKHFHNKSELLKEQKLYSILVNSRLKSETKANILINSILENAKKINKSILKKEKYNLIKEIKFNYNIEDFFKTKINNYNNFASIYTLFESLHLDNINPIQITNNRYNLLENIVKKDSYIDKEDNIFEEYNKYDKGTRLLIYKLLIEKFNDKYSVLSKNQRLILKEYINNINEPNKLKHFLNSHIFMIKKELNNIITTSNNKTLTIKLNEIINIIKPLSKIQQAKDNDLIVILQGYELINELKNEISGNII